MRLGVATSSDVLNPTCRPRREYIPHMAKTLTSDETLSFIWALIEQDSTGTAWWADWPVRVPVQKAPRQLAVEWSEHKFEVPVRSTLQDTRQQLKKNADRALNAVKTQSGHLGCKLKRLVREALHRNCTISCELFAVGCIILTSRRVEWTCSMKTNESILGRVQSNLNFPKVAQNACVSLLPPIAYPGYR